MIDQLEFIYRGGKTKRFHTADTLTEQNVAEHSFGVAWICAVIYGEAVRKELLLAALAHDLAEHRVGDVSSVVKTQHPDLRQKLELMETNHLVAHELDFAPDLSDEEKKVLKMADMMEGMLFCIRERWLGSRASVGIYGRYRAYTLKLEPSGKAKMLIDQIHNVWETVNGGK